MLILTRWGRFWSADQLFKGGEGQKQADHIADRHADPQSRRGTEASGGILSPEHQQDKQTGHGSGNAGSQYAHRGN